MTSYILERGRKVERASLSVCRSDLWPFKLFTAWLAMVLRHFRYGRMHFEGGIVERLERRRRTLQKRTKFWPPKRTIVVVVAKATRS